MLFNPFSVIKSIQRNTVSLAGTQTIVSQNFAMNVNPDKSVLFFSVVAFNVDNSPMNYLIQGSVRSDHVQFQRGAGSIGDDLEITWTVLEYR